MGSIFVQFLVLSYGRLFLATTSWWRHFWHLLPCGFLKLSGYLGYFRNFDDVSTHILREVHEFPLCLQPENIVSQRMWLHRSVCQYVINLHSFFTDVASEIVADIRHLYFCQLRQRSQRRLILLVVLHFRFFLRQT